MKLKLNVALLLLLGLVGCSTSPNTPALVQGEAGSYLVLLNSGASGPAVAQEVVPPILPPGSDPGDVCTGSLEPLGFFAGKSGKPALELQLR